VRLNWTALATTCCVLAIAAPPLHAQDTNDPADTRDLGNLAAPRDELPSDPHISRLLGQLRIRVVLPELQSAQNALLNNEFDRAAKVSSDVLKRIPDSTGARYLYARSLLWQNNLIAARQHIDKLMVNPIAPQAQTRMLAIRWAHRRMTNIYQNPKFPRDHFLAVQFWQTMRFAMKQAVWVGRKNGHEEYAVYMAGILAEIDLKRLDIDMQFVRERIAEQDGIAPDAVEIDEHPDIKSIADEINKRRHNALKYFRTAYGVNPTNPHIVGHYAHALSRLKNWDSLWLLTKAVSQEHTVDPQIADRLAAAVAMIPDNVKTEQQRTEIVQRLESAIAQADPAPAAPDVPADTSPAPPPTTPQPAMTAHAPMTPAPAPDSPVTAPDQPARPASMPDTPALPDAPLIASEPPPSGNALTSARLLMLDGKFEAAQRKLNDHLQNNPADPDARFLLARCRYERKEYDAAREILAELANEFPNNVAVSREFGRTLEQLGGQDLAQATYAQATKMNLQNAQSKRALMIHEFARSPELSQADIEKMYADDPADPKAILFKLNMEKAEARHDEVRRVVESTETIAPLEDSHVYLLTDGYKFLGELKKAEHWARELVDRRPDVIETHIRLAETMLAQGNVQEVEQYLQTVQGQFKNGWEVKKILGALYVKRSMFDKAMTELTQVLAVQPDDVSARLMTAQALAGLSQTDDAITHLRHVLDRDPNHVRANVLAARIYQFRGDTRTANEYLDRIDASQSGASDGPALLAQLKLRQGDVDGARDLCLRAIAGGNTEAMLRTLLVHIYMRQDNPAEAQKHVLALLRAQPNRPQVYDLATRFYKATDNITQGLTELRNLQAQNDTLSRLAQATLLHAAEQTQEALNTLLPAYQSLIDDRKQLALIVANTLTQLYLQLEQHEQAHDIFDSLIAADLFTTEATLSQIQLRIGVDPTDKTIRDLRTLSRNLDPQRDTRLNYRIIQTLVQIKKPDLALILLDRWIAYQPKAVTLLRWKASLLSQLGRTSKALTIYDRAVQLQPNNIAMQLERVKAYLAIFDYPSAETCLANMMSIDDGARVASLTAMGQMYVGLGLNQRAAATFEQLEQTGQARDPGVLLAMGRALAALDVSDQARAKLDAVPAKTSQFVAAQMLLAQLEVRAGQTDLAAARLKQMLATPAVLASTVNELLKLNLRSEHDGQLIRLADQAIAIDQLSEPQRLKWLGVRVSLEASKKGWLPVLAMLEQLQASSPDRLQLSVARIVLLLRLDEEEAARELYRSDERIAASPIGPLIAMLVREVPRGAPKSGPVSEFLFGLASRNKVRAGRVLNRFGSHTMLYRTDIAPLLDRPDASSLQVSESAKQLIGALLAMQSGIPELAAELAEEQTVNEALAPVAYGLLIQAQSKLQQSTDVAMHRVRDALPDSTLALFVGQQLAVTTKEFDKALEFNEALLAREPENSHALYRHALLLQRAQRYDDALELLHGLWEGESNYRLSAGNDLAYLMAERQPHLIEEAHQIAQKVLTATPNSAPLLDTLGWIEHQRGDSRQALAYMGRAVSQLSALPEVHYHMGMVYRDLGNAKWARYHLEQAASGDADNPDVEKARQALQQQSAKAPQ
jgi:tetratricopeptide (TPR) repeat protein